MYELVIFDLDGTLVDSVGDIADALNRTLGTTFSDGDVARWVGSGVDELIRRAGGDPAEASKRFRAAYAEQPVARTRPYLGVRETLKQIDCAQAIATNKPGQLARTIVEKLGLAGQFVAVLGEDDVGARKPDPLIVDLLRGKVGASRAATLYVGDSLVDAATAEAAGVALCLVTYGYADPEAIRSHPAKHHIDRFADLAKVVRA
jgi:phosphoglycolate phosphatase